MDELEVLLAMFAEQMSPNNNNNPLIGYGDPYQMTPSFVIDPSLPTADRVLMGNVDPAPQTVRDEIRFTDVKDVLSTLDDDDKNFLALELFTAGAFTDIDDMFDENFERDELVFNSVVENAINFSQQATDLGFESTYLKVLMGAGESDKATVLKNLVQAKADAAKEKAKGGRMIQYANPQAIVKSLRDASPGALGRRASKREQRDFVKRIHNMQAKGLSVNVAAEAEFAAKQAAPVEAESMDYSNARNSMMRVIMSKVGKV